jgi:thioredoxin 1
VIDQVAKDLSGIARVGKVNVEENAGLTQAYQVDRIPTLLFFRKGRLAGRLIGLQPKERIKQELEALK